MPDSTLFGGVRKGFLDPPNEGLVAVKYQPIGRDICQCVTGLGPTLAHTEADGTNL
jgi:hypothetical protein